MLVLGVVYDHQWMKVILIKRAKYQDAKSTCLTGSRVGGSVIGARCDEQRMLVWSRHICRRYGVLRTIIVDYVYKNSRRTYVALLFWVYTKQVS